MKTNSIKAIIFRLTESQFLSYNLTRSSKLDQSGLQEVIQLMRSAAAEYTYDIYIIRDHDLRRTKGSSGSAVTMLDAITNYNVYGSLRAK
jgi:hypothetical protein